MLKNLFKPKWQHKDFTVRKAAAMKLDARNPEDAEILAALSNDENTDVRKEAISRLNDIDLLLTMLNGLVENESHANIQVALQTRLANLICGNEIEINSAKKIEALDTIKNPHLYQQILKQSNDADLQLAAMTHVTDQSQLFTLAWMGSTAKVRQLAASAITDFELLKKLGSKVKSKDKTVYRIVKNSLDERRESQREKQQEQAECERICTALETHSRLSMDPLFQAKLNHLLKQWQELPFEHTQLFSKRFEQAKANCDITVNSYVAEEAKRIQAGEKSADASKELNEALRVTEEALQIMQQYSDVSDTDFPALQGILKTQRLRWEEASSTVKPAANLQSRFIQASNNLNSYLESSHCFIEKKTQLIHHSEAISNLDKKDLGSLVNSKQQLNALLKEINWPNALPKPLAIQSAEGSLNQVGQFERQLGDSKSQITTQIKQGLLKLEDDISAGKLKPATKNLRDLQNLIKSIPLKEASSYQQKIRELAARLNELNDWQGFATTPKKQQLCEQMESLIDSGKDPQNLANEIKAIQEEWKGLGRAEPKAEKQLWNRFKAAGDQAFEPCKKHFAGQGEIRSKNLELRQQLCEQLADYFKGMNWEDSVDWSNVLEILKTAKQQWRSYSPIERKSAQAVQSDFDELIKQLQGKLDQERNNNANKKEALIDQITALHDEDDIESAISQTKRLQQDWKRIGMTERKVDSRLWKSFREAGDAVFARRQQLKEDAEAERAGNQAKAEAVCAAVKNHINAPNEELINSKGKLKQFKENFDQCLPLPTGIAAETKKKFEKLCNDFSIKVQHAKDQVETKRFETLWDKSAICTELEQSILEGSLDDNRLSSFKERWNDAGELPDAAIFAMNARFDAAVNAHSASTAKELKQELPSNTEKLHALTLKMEIIAGVESPSEDRQKRMELQVDRLSQSMTGSSITEQQEKSADEKRALLIEWCALGPAEKSSTSHWELRFKQAYTA